MRIRIGWAAVTGLLMLGLAMPARAASEHVHIQGFAFAPKNVSVEVGDSVTWDNHDSVIHTATSDVGAFDSGVLANGQSYSFIFSTAGSFPYHCAIHPSMTGTVNVVDPIAPDLVVDSLTVTETSTFGREVSAVIRNAGLTAAGSSVVRIEEEGATRVRDILSAGIGELAPGASTTVTTSWDVGGKMGDFVVRAFADDLGEVVELSEGNNVGSTTHSILVGGVPGIDLLRP